MNCAARAGGTAPEGVFGDFVMCLGGFALNELTSPRGVAVDANGTVWIADALNYRVLKFLNGQFRANQPTADGLQGLTKKAGQEKNHRHAHTQATKTSKATTKTNATNSNPKQAAQQTASTNPCS